MKKKWKMGLFSDLHARSWANAECTLQELQCRKNVKDLVLEAEWRGLSASTSAPSNISYGARNNCKVVSSQIKMGLHNIPRTSNYISSSLPILWQPAPVFRKSVQHKAHASTILPLLFTT